MAAADDFYPEIWEIFEQMRKDSLCLDAEIICEGKTFLAHKAVLAANSTYFKDVLTQSQPDDKTVFLHEICAKRFEDVLNYMYTRKINCTECNVHEFLDIALNLEMEGLKNRCELFYANGIVPENALQLWKIATRKKLNHLLPKVHSYILQNFEEISSRVEFLFLNTFQLYGLLKMDELNVKSEEKVYETMIKWLEHKPKERCYNLPMLLKTLRMGLIDLDYFMSNILDNPYVKDNKICNVYAEHGLQFLQNLSKYGNLRVNLGNPMVRPRIPDTVIFVVGGWCSTTPIKTFETYDTRCDRWFSHDDLCESVARAYHGMAVVNNCLYVFGGYDGDGYYKSTRKFDPVVKTWCDYPTMSEPKCYLCAVHHENYVYVCGGFNGHIRLNTVERFNLETHGWERVEKMRCQRSDCGGVSFNDMLVVAGGYNGFDCLRSVECYNSITEQWSYFASMNVQRSGINLVATQGCIYVVGGFDGISRMRTVEKFDPLQQEWLMCEPMFTPRSNYGMTVLDDMIFVIGGFNGSRTIPHVECYSPELDTWYDATDLNTPRSAFKACAISSLPNIRDYTYYGNSEQEKIRLLKLKLKSVCNKTT